MVNVLIVTSSPFLVWIAYQVCYDMIYQKIIHCNDFDSFLMLKQQKINNKTQRKSHIQQQKQKNALENVMSNSERSKTVETSVNDNQNNNEKNNDHSNHGGKGSSSSDGYSPTFCAWILNHKHTWGNPSYNAWFFIPFAILSGLIMLVFAVVQCVGKLFSVCVMHAWKILRIFFCPIFFFFFRLCLCFRFVWFCFVLY